MTGESVDMIAHRSATPTLESHNSLEAQRIGRLDQGAVHPDEQGKAEEEGQAGVPVRPILRARGQRRNAKSGGRQARHPYPLGLLTGWASRDSRARSSSAPASRHTAVRKSHSSKAATPAKAP